MNKENRCAFPIRPSTKQERADYAMIEESVLENERRGNFLRVYPSDLHLQLYRNFFEEERRNDTILYSYVYASKYKNMQIDVGADQYYLGTGGSTLGHTPLNGFSSDRKSQSKASKQNHYSY